MSNHIKGNWFVSVFQMQKMSMHQLWAVAINDGYRETTRRNAKLYLDVASKRWRS